MFMSDKMGFTGKNSLYSVFICYPSIFTLVTKSLQFLRQRNYLVKSHAHTSTINSIGQPACK